ncbi:hypothetical protein V5735_21865 (plasmid) [Haladaptatus sp. SPP-AMP-3]|uniref:hypothetical protein n=1 Tax=Haladaptatus sp. SPP-AMP-3 TaxID=3121295 RepID=UPI003C2F8060
MNVERTLRNLLFLGIGLEVAASPVAAHTGTTHAATPHWILFSFFVGGICVMAGVAAAIRRELLSIPLAGVLLTASAVTAVFGGIGLVETQIVGRAAPQLIAIYPVLSLFIGGLLAVGGFLLVLTRYPTKPQYALLCMVLAGWILYPTVMPGQGYYNPLGYLLVLSLPAIIAYIVWTDARGVLQSLRLQTTPKLVGIVAGLLMCVFFAFSAGTMSIKPDSGINAPTSAFIIPYDVASPLVVWPAVEWYFPSIPFTGYLSVGSFLLMAILGGLTGLNASIVTQQWTGSESVSATPLFSGSLAASGATACCCCAPAFYGALSVLFGTAVTPVYWSFMIPSSPVGSTFFAASVLLLLWSIIRATGASAGDACAVAPSE